jgi:SAM-dependent methyltransferase
VTTDRRYVVQRCRSCGTAFTTPRPTPEQLEHFYERAYFEGETGFGYDDCGGTSWAAANASRAWGDLTRWEPGIDSVRPRRLLDVGCATGDLLVAARADGWAVTGVEVSRWARDLARGRQGLEVVSDLSEVPPGDGFGLVTMVHVLEHLVHPLPTLLEVRQRVEPGGLLVVEVPHWRSLGRLVRGSGWSQLRPPEHITFFDQGSMRRLRARAGFGVMRLETPYPNWQDRWQAARGRERWQVAPGALAASLAQRARLGGYLRVLARPDREVDA